MLPSGIMCQILEQKFFIAKPRHEVDSLCAAWLSALDWSRKSAWHHAKESNWVLDGDIVGRSKKVGPLSFVRIFGAGHMVIPCFTLDRVKSGLSADDLSQVKHARSFSANSLNVLQVLRILSL